MVDGKIDIRPLTSEEIPLIVNYWVNAKADDLQAMGADPAKIPTADGLSDMLQFQLDQPIEKRKAYALIWYYNDQPIGHCNLNPLNYSDHGFLHLHIWNLDQRKSGLGTVFVQKSVRHFFDVLKLKKIYSEPYSLNVGANKTLEKAGFIYVKTYLTTPGSINFEQEVNRWEIQDSINS